MYSDQRGVVVIHTTTAEKYFDGFMKIVNPLGKYRIVFVVVVIVSSCHRFSPGIGLDMLIVWILDWILVVFGLENHRMGSHFEIVKISV